jgi:8-oxo-dGTP diphosphatase
MCPLPRSPPSRARRSGKSCCEPARALLPLLEPDWTPRERATLLFVIREGRILLIRKKRGLGAGKINGPGGHLEPGETPRQAAIREVQEELCITPHGVHEAGLLRFQFTDGHSIEGTVFTAGDYEGTPTETDEAIPLWTPLDAIPYEEMWLTTGVAAAPAGRGGASAAAFSLTATRCWRST